MNPDLLSASLSLAFMGIVGAALLGLAAARRHPVLRLADAVAAAGLLYLFGTSAFGWSFLPREAAFALYAALFSGAAAIALTRRARGAVVGFPAPAILIQQGAMAYIFAPFGFWRPLLSLLLTGYFLFETISWLRGSEAPVADAGPKNFRPPLFPPKRLRGAREFALAGLGSAFVYVFAMGAGMAPIAPPPEPAREEPAAPVSEAPAETTVGEEAPTAATAEETKEPAAAPIAPAAAQTYTAAAGETLKSIAKKLYGKPDDWRALAGANPGLKPSAKLKAGQVVKLPKPPAK